MSDMTYSVSVDREDRPLIWLAGEVKTPPFSPAARLEAGILLRRLQRGEQLHMPHARPMPAVGRRCLEVRIQDERNTWRIMLRVDPDAVVIAEVFEKKTRATPANIIARCKARLKRYDDATKE
jgi:phage-related protein